MRKLCFDLGSKTCGISISDDTNLIANGIVNFIYQKNNFNQIIIEIKKILVKYENSVDTFILGFATNPRDNSLVESSYRSLSFKELLEESFPNIKVILHDENFSTIKANNLMINNELKASQRKKRIDKVASIIILQDYLDNIK